MQKTLTVNEIQKKLERFCAYQERCHDEVVTKLREFTRNANEIDTVIVHLIQNDFLNEERFAKAFARGKHRIKSWGKNRIENELKLRHISARNITSALMEIADCYGETFDRIASRQWENLAGEKGLKKRKKFCDYLVRKGYESDLVYARLKVFEKG
jgi:regulatory protein